MCRRTFSHCRKLFCITKMVLPIFTQVSKGWACAVSVMLGGTRPLSLLSPFSISYLSDSHSQAGSTRLFCVTWNSRLYLRKNAKFEIDLLRKWFTQCNDKATVVEKLDNSIIPLLKIRIRNSFESESKSEIVLNQNKNQK